MKEVKKKRNNGGSFGKQKLHTTGVWQNGGISAKLSICTSINISAKLKVSASKSATVE
jgi:hypothetical protein